MSKTTDCDTAPTGAGSVEHRLARLLEAPVLARVVPHLPPETLHRLVRHCGLEACGEILTSATPAQLTSLLDLDLWRPPQPGRDERFDADRFGEWVEVLVEAGDPVAARTVAALDEDLVIVGLSRYVRVFDPGIFEPVAQSDDEPVDRDEAMREGDVLDVDEAVGSEEETDDAGVPDSSGHGIECEMGGYIVRARRVDAWDAIVALLVALEAGHGPYFHAVMQGCRRLSHSRPEKDGLDDLLLAPEQQLHDVAIGRESRRSQQGYATPADARAFLQMARRPERPPSGVNPIVAAYFRAAAETPESKANAHTAAPDVPEPMAAVIELLAEAGLMPERRLLEAAEADPRAVKLARLRHLLTHVRDADETAYLARGRELAFLANALLAGCTVEARPFTPQEASDAAAAICNLGLESMTDPSPPDARPDVIDHDLVTAFEAGWSVLHREVSLFVAERLLSTLREVRCVDRDIRRGLVALQGELRKQRDAGTPWRARGAAEVLAMLDPTACAGVLGLLGECPVLPAALTAVLDGRTTTVSPTGFDFISTAAQLGDVRAFMSRLPDLLSR